MSTFLSIDTIRQLTPVLVGFLLTTFGLEASVLAYESLLIEGATQINETVSQTGNPPQNPGCGPECIDDIWAGVRARRKGDILVNPRDVLPEERLGQIEVYETLGRLFKRPGQPVEDFFLSSQKEFKFEGVCATPGELKEDVFLKIHQIDQGHLFAMDTGDGFSFSNPETVFFNEREAKREEDRRGPIYSILVMKKSDSANQESVVHKYYKKIEPRQKDKFVAMIMEKTEIKQIIPNGKTRTAISRYCMYALRKDDPIENEKNEDSRTQDAE